MTRKEARTLVRRQKAETLARVVARLLDALPGAPDVHVLTEVEHRGLLDAIEVIQRRAERTRRGFAVVKGGVA